MGMGAAHAIVMALPAGTTSGLPSMVILSNVQDSPYDIVHKILTPLSYLASPATKAGSMAPYLPALPLAHL